MRPTSAVAAELRELAGRPAYRNCAPALTRLAGDLDAGNTTPWRKVDLLAFFDADLVTGNGTGAGARLARHVELVRNLLLFLPLLITWGGIYFAVQAYRSLLNAPAAEQAQFADASFLQMWTRGFGDRTWITLDVVALLDSGAILGVIVFSLLGTWLQRKAEAAEEDDRLARVDALQVLLIEAGLAVHLDGGDAIDRLAAKTEKLLPLYQDTLDHLVTTQREMIGLVDAGRGNIAELSRITGDLAHTGSTIAASVKDLEDPTAALTAHVREVDTAVGSLVSGLSGVTTGLPGARDALHQVVAQVEGLNRDLREVYAGRIEELRSETAAHGAAATELAHAREELASSLDRGRVDVAELARAARTMADSSGAISDSSDHLRANLTTLTTTTAEFGGHVQSLVQESRGVNEKLPAAQQGVLDVLTGVRDLGRKLDDIYARQEVVTQELGYFVDIPLATVQAVKRSVDEARRIEEALQAAVQALPVQMDRLREAVLTALDRELDERRSAAGEVGGALGQFNGAAVQAAQALREAADEFRAAPESIAPDLRAASDGLARSLDQSRELVESLNRLAEHNGSTSSQGSGPKRRRWPWSGSGRVDGRVAG
ncbi:hypothetical protein IOD16_06780 [Saccharothrix sp. 6-C]|uniref:hypothetical protein n=1 Tax=Saccharothrix sp. 6-C TaxID=2781735 RepID=UPI0019170D1B|nr:hypothetical protein [Saccharothrix sp. 6-C]QQQ78170.1 hypothetical protein IOD16_06780 [Saccharothrix sp. 6-C]